MNIDKCSTILDFKNKYDNFCKRKDKKLFKALKRFIEIIKEDDIMGYRSSVRILTTKKGFNELRKFTNDYLKDKNSYNLLDNPEIMSKGVKSCYIGWNYLKWYDEYPEVEAINKGLEKLEEKDIPYRFAILGESYDDYEEYIYDSEKKNIKDNDLDYPCLIREFDDDYIIEGINQEQFKDKEKDLCS